MTDDRAERQPSGMSSEASYIAALQAGDDRAAETLVRTHAPWMISVARRIVRDHHLAEDCVQEAFVQVFRKIGAFEGRSKLKSWMHRIVVNQALMKIRSAKTRKEASIDELLPDFDENACRIEASWGQLATPDEIFEREDCRNLVLRKISELPESYRMVIQLRDIEDLPTRDVADALGLSESNVKVRLHRARSALKKLLEPVLRGEV